MNSNKVVRKCNQCGSTDEFCQNFTYLGDGVWTCHNCSCKYTHIASVEKIERYDDDDY
jgi:ribosomal protein L37AE/L43A